MRDPADAIGASRIRIGYRVDLHYELLGPGDFVFNIHASRSRQQRVLSEAVVVDPPVAWRVETERSLGNRWLRLHAGAGALDVRYVGTVEVRHHVAEPSGVTVRPITDLPLQALRFLRPSRYCQSDRLQALAWREFGRLAPGHDQVDAVCRWVRSSIEFRAGASTPSTSALETLVQRAGVCRDFVHVSIALLRALNYPARFVTGVDYGADEALGPPDFHSYLEAYIADRWWLFDPAGISPLTGLIRIGTGRDAADVAFATMFGRVRGSAPKVAFAAADDPSAGIVRPRATRLAVSTA
jgi:transglutaminase-like putative cysteine protease